ncbi:glycoside hydrolase family 26 protein [Curtobacterium oceanosedimentum]|uniref:glycoside hydrolase family 26 protein n=1 Tax=Curtobacterium oceanosedimentum TaxID=465820 RepID=UPI001CE035E9|nr:glycosyl hydrolase [Curtobacterium oceanosedimentum]MCA5923786.1 hypothetical protein [Curtobacterium oceanosedimentum]
MRTIGRITAAVASLAVVTTVAAGCAAHTTSTDHDAARVGTSSAHIALGMYYGDRSLAATNKALGTTPAIHLTYFDWASDWSADPVLAADARRGQTSLVNWEPFDVDFHDIVAGEYDDVITEQAEGAAALTNPVLLDFAAEMNEEEGWGGHDPELYIAAWRHVHDIFAEKAAGKVQWVWAPNNTDSEGAPTAIEYYPGSHYVDWTGIDGYNWGTSDDDFDWQSFTSVFRDTYRVLHELGKPIIIGETASDEVGGDKAKWIRDIIPTLETTFPDIEAVVWFDVEKERDWRIRSSSRAFAAFRQLANDPSVVPADRRHPLLTERASGR